MQPIDDILNFCQTFHLSTERLILRRFIDSDQENEVKQQKVPEVVQFIRDPLNQEEAVEFFKKFLKPWSGNENEWLGICVEHKSEKVNIGAISFRFQSIESAVVEIGYRLHTEFQGNGFAIEAVAALVNFIFTRLQVHKIIALCDPDNQSSYKLMEKLGMQREGLLRQHFKIGDHWTDELVYGLLADEWLRSPQCSV